MVRQRSIYQAKKECLWRDMLKEAFFLACGYAGLCWFALQCFQPFDFRMIAMIASEMHEL